MHLTDDHSDATQSVISMGDTTMSAMTMTVETTTIFELVRWVDGQATAYRPYASDCAGCCTPVDAAEPAQRSCCSGN